MASRGPIARLPQGQAADYFQMGRLPWWFPPEIRNRQLDAFTIPVDFAGANVLPASLTSQIVVAIPGDASFLILAATAVVTATDDVTFLAAGSRPILVTMSTAGGGRFLASGAVHIDNWFGTGQQPKYWDAPKILAPNENLTILLSNLQATARNVRLAFHGFKVFGYSR